jgi:hypothetical protein
MMLDSGQLLLRHNTTVTCPKCATEFSLDQGFAKKALDQLSEVSAEAISAMREAERTEVEKRAQQLAGEKARAAQGEAEALKKLLKEQGVSHAKELTEVRGMAERDVAPRIEELQKSLAEQTGQVQALRAREDSVAARERDLEARVNAAAQAKATEIVAVERKSFEQQLNEKNSQVATLRGEQLELRKEREQLKDEKAALALEVQKQVDTQLQHRESVVRAQEQAKAQLEKAQLQKKLDDAGEQLAAAQRKMDQGSQQLQGEVLELAVEESLRRAFPFDVIEEVKKGARGGDIIQRVMTRSAQPAGVILWETKRAKDWSPQWVSKLKEDMRDASAEVGVVVTMACPKEFEPQQTFGLHEDIWVTSWATAIHLAECLRRGLLDVHKQRLISAGKGEKMEAIFDYVTSPQFAQKLKAVYESFAKMREELESEKNSTMQRWARREKQLQGSMTQLLGIGGEIQGLAQQELPVLELESPPSGDDA